MINKIIISGYVGADCEVKKSINDTLYATFSICNTRHTKTETKTMWIDCICSQHMVASFPYIRKGRLVTVCGELRIKMSGEKKYISIICDEVAFMDKKPDDNTNIEDFYVK